LLSAPGETQVRLLGGLTGANARQESVENRSARESTHPSGTAAAKKANWKIACLQLATISSTTAVLIALGVGLANATTRDAAGRTI
jgi:hypothetical protein